MSMLCSFCVTEKALSEGEREIVEGGEKRRKGGVKRRVCSGHVQGRLVRVMTEEVEKSRQEVTVKRAVSKQVEALS